MRYSVVLLVVLVTLFLPVVVCGPLPSNPNTDPNNARTEFRTVNDSDPVQPVIVHKDSVVELALKLRLPMYINEISFTIESNNKSVDTLLRVSGPWGESDTLERFIIIFPEPGTKKCIVTTLRSNESELYDTLIFDVEMPGELVCPVWISDTIIVISLEKSHTSVAMRSNVELGSEDEAVINLVDQLDNMKFMWNDDSLAIDTSVDTGTYYGRLVVGDNDCTDTVIIQWTVKQPPLILRPDTVAVAENGLRIIDVLENDSASFGTIKLHSVYGGRLGSVVVRDSFIEYTAEKGKSGQDTVIYTVNGGRDSGFIFITILPIVVIAKNDKLTIDEDAPTVTIDVLENDSVSTGSAHLTSVERARLGSVSYVNNKLAYTPHPDKNGTDTVIYIVNNATACTLFVTISPVDDPPIITRNNGLTVIEGDAAAIDSTCFLYSDSDDPAPSIEVKIIALPVNGVLERSGSPVDTQETFSLYDFICGSFIYQHDGSETAADSITVAIATHTQATITIKVTPINDPPAFSKTSAAMNTQCGLGNYYRDTVVISDPEKNYCGFSFTVSPPSLVYSFDTTSGRLVIDWSVDNRTYSIDDDVPLSVNVKDGELSETLEWNLKVGRHAWTKVAENVESYGVFAAVDSFVMFNAWISNDNYIQIEKCNLKQESTWKPFASTGRLGGTQPIEELRVFNNKLFCCCGEAKSFDVITGAVVGTVIPENYYYSDIFLDNNGDVYGRLQEGSEIAIYYKNGEGLYGIMNPSSPFGVYNDILFTINFGYNENGIDTGYTIERWSGDCVTHSMSCRNISTPIRSGASYFSSDGNNGDTLYIGSRDYFGTNGFWLCRIPNSQSQNMIIEDLPVVNAKTPLFLMMLDGSTGFMVDSTGSLYFTNDGFATLDAEEFAPFEQVHSVCLSADKKAIFVLSRMNLNKKRNFYRY